MLPAASKVILTTLVLSNPGINETVRRTRGMLWVGSDQIALMEEQNGAIGAMVLSDAAIAVGVASLPDPVTDSDDDGWLMWMPFYQASASVQGGTVIHTTVAAPYQFDSKAMRRVEEGYSVAFIGANANATTGLRIALAVSVLTSLS